MVITVAANPLRKNGIVDFETVSSEQLTVTSYELGITKVKGKNSPHLPCPMPNTYPKIRRSNDNLSL